MCNSNLFAQDIHFSQYFNSPQNLNPALTSFSQYKYRLSLNNRTQWATVSVPYKTYSGSFEMRLAEKTKKRSFFGIGILFNKDEAGDSKFGTNKSALSLSWAKSINRKGNNIISIALQGAFYQRSIDFTNLNFNDSWNISNPFNKLPTSESFSYSQISFFDISSGVLWHYSPSKKFKINSSFAIWHINEPNQSFSTSYISKLKMKYSGFTEAQILISENIYLLPSFYISKQFSHIETIEGIKIYNKFSYKYSFYYGFYYRNKDALILYSALENKNLLIGVSYDINLSKLSTASKYMGGLEISLQYNIDNRKTKADHKPIKCPIF